MKVSRLWQRQKWDRQAKRDALDAVTVNVVWPDTTPSKSVVHVGSTVTVEGFFTLVVTGPREVRITPPMTSEDFEELSAEAEREIRAKYGLKPAVGG